MIYYCKHCGWYLTENETYLLDVDLEDEYGVGDMFPNHHYETCRYCADCDESNLTEVYSTKIELDCLLETLEENEIPLDDYVSDGKECFTSLSEDEVVELFNHILLMIKGAR